MRVNLSYSLEFEEIPEEVLKLLIESQEKQAALQFQYEETREFLSNDNVSTAVKNIDRIRQNLIQIDARLQDCANILMGYQQALSGAQIQANDPGATPGDVASKEQNVEENQIEEVQVEEG
jgi:hypothetical protein